MDTGRLIRRGAYEWEIPATGAMRVPAVIFAEDALLVMEFIETSGGLTESVQEHAAELLARLQQGLVSNHAQAAYFLDSIVGVGNHPVAPQQPGQPDHRRMARPVGSGPGILRGERLPATTGSGLPRSCGHGGPRLVGSPVRPCPPGAGPGPAGPPSDRGGSWVT